jgi:excisionase family DNA binding protein
VNYLAEQNGQEFVEIEEAAKLLNVSRKTLDKHAKAHDVQRYKGGLRNKVYFRRQDVEMLRDQMYTIKPDTRELT